MNRSASPARMDRRRSARVLVVMALCASSLSVAGGTQRAEAAPPYCGGAEPGKCLPTPAECATGEYNGQWKLDNNPFAIADCVGYVDSAGQRHIRRYEAGSTNPPCGLIVENDDLVVGGFWHDPNRCFAKLQGTPKSGTAMTGTRYRSAVSGAGGVVASISEAASKAGLEMLAAGGNAVDAGVAAVFAVGVTNPETCGIGAGGFLVARMADGRVRVLDFRETAPKAMTAHALDLDGINRWGTGHRVVGVPGTVAGMAEALRALGTKSLAQAISNAQALAGKGVEVSMSTANEYILAGARGGGPVPEERLKMFPEAARIYLNNGLGYIPGAILKQSDYARSLALIAKYGPDAFYLTRDYPEGKSIGALIVEEMEYSRAHPVAEPDDPDHDNPEGDRSLMTAEDLAAYRPIWRKALRSDYRGYGVLSAPPPNAGGIQTQEILNILESFNLAEMGHSSANWLHVLVEAQKIARADRDKYVADPAFEDVPTSQLTSQGYANTRAAEIKMEAAQEFQAGNVRGDKSGSTTTGGADGEHTTHVSVVDRAGNAVAVTCTLEQAFGSAVVAPGTGFLLNNQLSDFSAAGTVNEPAGGKRPRSNTAPTIVVRDDRAVLVLGGMGGFTIPMGVVHVVTNAVDFGMDIAHAIDAARGYPLAAARGYPVDLEIIDGEIKTPLLIEHTRLAPEVIEALGEKGHPIVRPPGEGEYAPIPIMQVAADLAGRRAAVSDSRSDYGSAAEQE